MADEQVKPTWNPECLHCQVVLLRHNDFPTMTLEDTIEKLCEVMFDGISLEQPMERRVDLLKHVRRVVITMTEEVLEGTYKAGATPQSPPSQAN